MLTIYKNCDTKEDFIWTIDIKEKYLEMWYNEMMRRFTCLWDITWEDVKREYLYANPVYDVDESYETGQISLWHLNEMINYINKTIWK